MRHFTPAENVKSTPLETELYCAGGMVPLRNAMQLARTISTTGLNYMYVV